MQDSAQTPSGALVVGSLLFHARKALLIYLHVTGQTETVLVQRVLVTTDLPSWDLQLRFETRGRSK